jgi:NAD(P)-dependent dehydrogenase (short-subunit alcohol dehydrogenase family)
LDFDDLQHRRNYVGFPVYSKSKLCNILFNRELARRIAGSGVTANALHPGFVATRFGDDSGGVIRAVLKVAKPIGAISPEEGAKTILYLASSPEVEGVSGEYFYERKPTTPTAEARKDDDAKRLWEISGQIAGFN